jgi:hypothetical protein
MGGRARQPGSCAKRMRVRPSHAHAPNRTSRPLTALLARLISAHAPTMNSGRVATKSDRRARVRY